MEFSQTLRFFQRFLTCRLVMLLLYTMIVFSVTGSEKNSFAIEDGTVSLLEFIKSRQSLWMQYFPSDPPAVVSDDKRLTLVVGRGYRIRWSDPDLWERRRQFATDAYKLHPSPWKLFVDPDTNFQEAHIIGKYQEETTFQAIEMWLKKWKDPQLTALLRFDDSDAVNRFDRIVFEKVKNDCNYGIPWSVELIERTFERLLRDKGTMEWYSRDPLYWPNNIKLNSKQFDLPIRPKISADGLRYVDGGPMTLRKKVYRKHSRSPLKRKCVSKRPA